MEELKNIPFSFQIQHKYKLICWCERAETITYNLSVTFFATFDNNKSKREVELVYTPSFSWHCPIQQQPKKIYSWRYKTFQECADAFNL